MGFREWGSSAQLDVGVEAFLFFFRCVWRGEGRQT